MKKKKKIVHRHKWEYDYEDCCRCGGGEVRWCECGEFQEMNYKPKVSKKTPLKRKNK
jgi:hypothetical protein